ncbi:MAG: PD-(D/E)XK nuclease family protein [Polyangiaceae bacterium]
MKPLVSLLVHGATLTEHDDLAPGCALIGRPVWGANALLSNLELRLGLPPQEASQAVRVQHWSRRLAELDSIRPRFYSRSYATDPVGTANALLGWRDQLVAAGWNGEAIADGGERLDTFRELETASGGVRGTADRLRRVESELQGAGSPPFEELLLAEARALWPERWQRVFGQLETLGTPVRTVPAAPHSSDVDTDLGHVQRALGGTASASKRRFKGDGSLVLLRAETSLELADALASLLREWNEPSAVVVRSGEAAVLDSALSTQGLSALGVDSQSAWRPILQVLPLAVELSFEPRDPYRVLELLTLPIGPFQGRIGRDLASALSEAPGIGGRPWQAAKDAIATWVTERAAREALEEGRSKAEASQSGKDAASARLADIAEWLEAPGLPAAGAPTATLVAVAERVLTWVRRRLGGARAQVEREPGDPHGAAPLATAQAALAQASAFLEALRHEPRSELDRVGARILAEQAAHAHALPLTREEVDRVAPVDAPAGLRCPRDLVIWWHAVAGTEWRPSARVWRRGEVDALRAAGVRLGDPAERLAAEAASWRSVVLSARKRLVLCVPRWSAGEPCDPHPIWDEIRARLGASDVDVARVTIDARQVLAGDCAALGDARSPATSNAGPLLLPPALSVWTIPKGIIRASANHSASSIESLVGCPLRWVFTYRAGLREGGIASLPRGPLLFGTLAHRFIEVLHSAGVLSPGNERAFETHLEKLLREEAAVLLRAGLAFEVEQLRSQVLTAAAQLADVLSASKLTVVAVEEPVVAPWRGGEVSGRLDLLLRSESGRDVVLDLKWGYRGYYDKLRDGKAFQLAIYAAIRKLATGATELPVAGYFSLSRAEIIATDPKTFPTARAMTAPPLSETWSKLEATASAVEKALSKGRVAVTGVGRSLPLVDELGIPSAEHPKYLAIASGDACEYCTYGALCGRNWETLA